MITEFNPSVIERTIELVDRSGAAAALLEALTPAVGRKPKHNTKAFLVGALLSVQWNGSLVIRDIHRTLHQHLPIDVQYALGVRCRLSNKDLLPEKRLYKFLDAFEKHMQWGEGSAPGLSDDERARRRGAVLDVVHSMLDVTLELVANTGSRAIDGSGVWSYARSPSKAPSGIMQRDAAGEPLHDESEDELKRASADRDARHGVKTRKDGERESYFGYELHASVLVPDGERPAGFAPLVEAFELTPAGTDIVEPSLRLLDRSIAMGRVITDLLADRLYSYKAEDRWYFALLRRGVRQHVDLHVNDQGFRDYDGMRMAAGWMHCPSTPDRLGRIDSVSPNADAATKAQFRESIEERQQFAFRRVARMNASSGSRWECPALDGRIGCPLREGTVEVAQLNGLPVVVNPPDPETAPACCTQRTVTTGHDAQPKVEQEFYWGSKKWAKRYAARTYVEGVFGNIKNPSTENLCRGSIQVRGLAKVTLFVGITLVAYNLRMARNANDLTAAGEGDVLLQRDVEGAGFVFVSDAESEMLWDLRTRRTSSL